MTAASQGVKPGRFSFHTSVHGGAVSQGIKSGLFWLFGISVKLAGRQSRRQTRPPFKLLY